MIPTGRTATRLPILERMIRPDSLVYPDGFRRDDALDVSAFHPVRITHAERVGHERTHSNGTENFWNQAPRHLRRVNGVPKQRCYLFLKACDWRFNGGTHQALPSQLNTWVKSRQKRP